MNTLDNQMSVKQWVKTLIIIAIPIVNLIFLIRWAFEEDNPRRNYSRAFLMVISTFIGVSLILSIIGGALGHHSYQEQTQSTFDYAAYEEYKKSIEEELNNNLEILDASIQNRDNEFKEIVGKVRNNSTSNSYSNFSITCNIYDKDNAIIQTVKILIEETVPEGETLKFNEWPIHGDASSVKVIRIN